MTFATVTVVVENALEDEADFTDETLMREYIDGVQREAEGDGYWTQVFVLWHEHDPDDEECACAQYATDHNPYAEWNGPAWAEKEGA